MRKIGVFTNLQKDTELLNTHKVINILESKKCEYICMDNSGVLKNDHELDAVIVLGGDGTMLSAARRFAPYGIDLLGVNIGRMGFLMDADMESLDKTIDAVISGEYSVETRLMLDITLEQNGECFHSYALNEAVISGNTSMGMVDVEVRINDILMDTMACDGVIVSTATGSTGYSLSAGGPVVTPSTDVLLITPVCMHSTRVGNMVISGNDKVTVTKRAGRTGGVLTVDGQLAYPLDDGVPVKIERADFHARFIRIGEKNFFDVLKCKLSEWTNY